MIKKRIKKIAKLSLLVGVKQIWGLLCNLYLLSYQPFLTLKTMKEGQNKLQLILVVLTAISPAIFYITARVVWDNYKYGRVLNSIGHVFLTVLVIEILIFSYLLYWSIKVIKGTKQKI